jgi:hypothetical protein
MTWHFNNHKDHNLYRDTLSNTSNLKNSDAGNLSARRDCAVPQEINVMMKPHD